MLVELESGLIERIANAMADLHEARLGRIPSCCKEGVHRCELAVTLADFGEAVAQGFEAEEPGASRPRPGSEVWMTAAAGIGVEHPAGWEPFAAVLFPHARNVQVILRKRGGT